MPTEQPDAPNLLERARRSANVVTFVAHAMAHTVEVHLHHGFGSRYLDLPAAAAIPVMFIYCAFWVSQDLRPMLYFLGLYLFRCATIRMQIFRDARSGVRRHSRYSGRSRLTGSYPERDELTLKRSTEPALVTVLGVCVLAFNAPLGFWLVLSALALRYTVELSLQHERIRAQDTFDGFLEQQRVTERFRRLLDDEPE